MSLLNHRQVQAKAGRPMPQVNEEYGYEDHYPGKWGGGKKAPARSADNRRRLAWGMYLAGGYQTTGERADRGTGSGPDSGGGWINGRGDDQMTMLEGYGHIVTCVSSLKWWKMEPRDDLVSQGMNCLAEPGQQYLVYVPQGGDATCGRAVHGGRPPSRLRPSRLRLLLTRGDPARMETWERHIERRHPRNSAVTLWFKPPWIRPGPIPCRTIPKTGTKKAAGFMWTQRLEKSAFGRRHLGRSLD
jgi:hypothetical protein